MRAIRNPGADAPRSVTPWVPGSRSASPGMTEVNAGEEKREMLSADEDEPHSSFRTRGARSGTQGKRRGGGPGFRLYAATRLRRND